MASKHNQSLVLYRYPEDPGKKNILRVLLYSEDKQSLSELKDVYNIMNPTGEKN